MISNLQNKLALVTGAASGIGLATAQLFADQGADLALVDISLDVKNVAKELQAVHSNKTITFHIYDLTVSSNVENLFEEIKSQHANYFCPTVLVNSAGIGRRKSFLQLKEHEYEKMLKVNLKATFLVTQALIKQLVFGYTNVKFKCSTESYASIINVSSVMGKNGGPGWTWDYIAKPGVDGFSKSVAKEFGRFSIYITSEKRIRCNAVLPYFIETPTIDCVLTEERLSFLASLPALKRFGKPDEVAELVYFLATDASSYITGSTIDINGGF